ncbi:MAG: GntR family transcriptional regulator [Planctomycetota bacterium]
MPISRTIREQVTVQLRDEVLSGAFAPGKVLREAELASRFGVSRGPVRDAFLQLANEGYLAYEPNRGVTVQHPPDQSDREFITKLRRQIELYVVRKFGLPVSADALEQVRSALDELRVACTANNLAAVKRCDLAFHETILLACGGENLVPAWKQLCSRMALAYERFDVLADVHEEHARVFRALEEGDGAVLEEELMQNIR